MRVSTTVMAAMLTAVVAGPAVAQDTIIIRRPERQPTEFERRSGFSISFAQTRPRDDLARNIGFGYGVLGTYHVRLDKDGFLGLRADLGISDYGENTQHIPFPETGRINLKVQTTNYIIPMSIGPQLTWPTGSIRPYVNAGVGGQWFYTESHLQGDDENGSFGSTTNQSDFTSAWTAGGGVYIPIVKGTTNVHIDLGAQYFTGGNAKYLNKGSIVDLPGGKAQISPIESATHLVVVRLGVRIGG